MATENGTLPAKLRRSARLKHCRRQGIATVEFAVIVPLLVLIFFGGITATHLFSLQHQATIVAHTAALEAMKTENDFMTVETRGEAFAASAGLRNVDVTVSLSSPEIVSVVVVIPVAGNFSLSNTTTPADIRAEVFAFRPAGP